MVICFFKSSFSVLSFFFFELWISEVLNLSTCAAIAPGFPFLHICWAQKHVFFYLRPLSFFLLKKKTQTNTTNTCPVVFWSGLVVTLTLSETLFSGLIIDNSHKNSKQLTSKVTTLILVLKAIQHLAAENQI